MTDTAASSSSATGATGIASGLGRSMSRANLEKAGQQFEAVFDGMMLKAMRQAKLSDGLFDSKAEDTFRDMEDTKVAQSMAVHQPIGIGKAMVDFLAKNQTALQAPAADAGTAT